MYKGKAIYNPSGKAGEYSYWACNFYVGCSNGCTYCYLKKGRGAKVLGGSEPTLKKCFRDAYHAADVLEKELKANIEELQKHGLFFSFTTDPMLKETWFLTWYAMALCGENNVPVKILTKVATFVDSQMLDLLNRTDMNKDLIAFGFTLTGHDELEPNASSNQERIEAMKKLHNAGFKTFASIEPVIVLGDSYRMIELSLEFCDQYKIGLESGGKYDKKELTKFFDEVNMLISNSNSKVYWKDSVLNFIEINRDNLHDDFCVNRDYNLFQ